MSSHAKCTVCFLLLGLSVTPGTVAQDKRDNSGKAPTITRKDAAPQRKAIHSRLLTQSESLKVLSAALDSRHRSELPSDCSHLVHGLYLRAGFPYEYASSADLYAGVGEFRRVANPQPGDLAVWRGHAGIVVDPVQHSFFSALRSGLGVEAYDSPYWKQRGQPRFYRYAKPARHGARPMPSASVKSAVLGTAKPRGTYAEVTLPDAWEKVASDASAPAQLPELRPPDTSTLHIPVVNSARPRADQVRAAFLQACKDGESSLLGRDLFQPAQSLVVFDSFVVKWVHISGDQGWVNVQINAVVSVTGNKAELHKRSEQQRWTLRRSDSKTWVLTPTPRTIYLPQHIAERILAHELAQLTEDSADTASRSQEKAELARLLNVLLEK